MAHCLAIFREAYTTVNTSRQCEITFKLRLQESCRQNINEKYGSNSTAYIHIRKSGGME